ncbi:hypothetical protein DPX16_2309 [Anabarilius grahami]|uniref:Secreted protein n=1 Tax=Anabarilius grahami TaxID=495550 RepID=A0A3N0Z3I4_ANAGA|nr:hypothetical protein DPX16_2309 [Anabarilius grahami]
MSALCTLLSVLFPALLYLLQTVHGEYGAQAQWKSFSKCVWKVPSQKNSFILVRLDSVLPVYNKLTVRRPLLLSLPLRTLCVHWAVWHRLAQIRGPEIKSHFQRCGSAALHTDVLAFPLFSGACETCSLISM